MRALEFCISGDNLEVISDCSCPVLGGIGAFAIHLATLWFVAHYSGKCLIYNSGKLPYFGKQASIIHPKTELTFIHSSIKMETGAFCCPLLHNTCKQVPGVEGHNDPILRLNISATKLRHTTRRRTGAGINYSAHIVLLRTFITNRIG